MRFERLFFSYIFLCWTLYPFSIPIILVREYNLSNLKMFRISGFLHKIYQIIAFHFIRGFEKILAYKFLYWTPPFCKYLSRSQALNTRYTFLVKGYWKADWENQCILVIHCTWKIFSFFFIVNIFSYP